MYAEGAVIDGRFRVLYVRPSTVGYICECESLSDGRRFTLKCLSLENTASSIRQSIYEKQKQEMRNLLHHGTEQVTEFFEKEVGTEKVFHIVTIQAQRTLSGVTADWRESVTRAAQRKQGPGRSYVVRHGETHLEAHVPPPSCGGSWCLLVALIACAGPVFMLIVVITQLSSPVAWIGPIVASSVIGLILIVVFLLFFTHERITITETEFEITRALDFRYCTSRAEASEGERSNELEEVMQNCLYQRIPGNTSELERAEIMDYSTRRMTNHVGSSEFQRFNRVSTQHLELLCRFATHRVGKVVKANEQVFLKEEINSFLEDLRRRHLDC